jgi:hypothetical protein
MDRERENDRMTEVERENDKERERVIEWQMQEGRITEKKRECMRE